MQLELFKIHPRSLSRSNTIVATLSASRDSGSGEYEEIGVKVVMEGVVKKELLGLSLSEIRQEAIE